MFFILDCIITICTLNNALYGVNVRACPANFVTRTLARHILRSWILTPTSAYGIKIWSLIRIFLYKHIECQPN